MAGRQLEVLVRTAVFQRVQHAVEVEHRDRGLVTSSKTTFISPGNSSAVLQT
jgi:hypothetical protein